MDEVGFGLHTAIKGNTTEIVKVLLPRDGRQKADYFTAMTDARNLIAKIDARKQELGIDTDAEVNRRADRRDLLKNIRTAAKQGRDYSITAEALADIARALDMHPAELGYAEMSPQVAAAIEDTIQRTYRVLSPREPALPHRPDAKPEPRLLHGRDLKVFAAAEGGPGQMVVSTEPIDYYPRPWYVEYVRDAFAVVVVGESMFPAYEPGDVVVVNPKAPMLRGKDAIFIATTDGGDWRASIKRLVRSTDTEYVVSQFNPPKELKLPKSEWQRAHRVVGKYNG